MVSSQGLHADTVAVGAQRNTVEIESTKLQVSNRYLEAGAKCPTKTKQIENINQPALPRSADSLGALFFFVLYNNSIISGTMIRRL